MRRFFFFSKKIFILIFAGCLKFKKNKIMKQILHNFKSNSIYKIRVVLVTGFFSMVTSFSTAQTTAIPDPIFEQKLINLLIDPGPTPNGSVPTANISAVTSLNLTNADNANNSVKISDLTGIEAFTSLTELRVKNNLITSINVSGLTSLTLLEVWLNNLTSLNVTANTSLTYLDCDQNQITSLNVSPLINLVTFFCNTNLLTTLDIRGLPLTANFQCSVNPRLSCILVGSIPVPNYYLKDATATYCTLTTWNGAWTPAVPSATSAAVIESSYSAAADITACSLTIKNNAAVTIPSNFNVNVNGALTVTTGSTFTLSNNANLVQTSPFSINTGAITVNRNGSPLKRLDYTLWSSPVASQNLLAFSPLTTTTRFNIFDTTYTIGGVNGAFSAIANPAITPFSVGTGYLIRMPNTDPLSGYDAGTSDLAYAGVFTGIPNNGDVPVTLIDGGSAVLRYNLVGNPYPSPISLSNFATENTSAIESNIYFWRKTNGLGTAYCTWVPGGLTGTFTTNGNSQSVNPLGVLQTGQGFFVQAKAGQTTVTFRNTQRVANNANQFFKTSKIVLDSRIWLNVTNADGDFSQMALTYSSKGTAGVDIYDARYINDSPFAFTSIINNQEYTIQGRPAFDPSDVVALNFKTAKVGDYTIAIDRVDGLFSGSQDIYLVDSKTGTETNLKISSYTFTAAAVVDNARFSLKFQKTLSLDAQAFNDNSVIVYKNGGVIYVNSGAKTMNNIKVFDIQGRLIAEQKSVKANTTSIQNLKASNQVLIVKVTTDDNKVISKKVEN